MNLLKQLSNNNSPTSLANYLRRKRFQLFNDAIRALGKPIRILDLGGTEAYWESMGVADEPGLFFVLLNLKPAQSGRPNFTTVAGDARSMPQFADHSFDVAFSNSVIEHVGAFADQQRMADEIRRVARCYCIQTPNYWFPMEPHFLFPGFQFLPLRVRAALIQRFSLGWAHQEPNQKAAEDCARSVNLLTKRDLQTLFPESRIYEERLLGLTKSLTAFSWPNIGSQ